MMDVVAVDRVRVGTDFPDPGPATRISATSTILIPAAFLNQRHD
jgi:hypothetical protein